MAKSRRSDVEAQQVVRLLRHPALSVAEQLDQLIVLLDLPGRPLQLRSNLLNVFEDASADGIDLLSPGDDFQAWVQQPLRRLGQRLGAAKANTVNARATTLSNFYTALEDLQLIRHHPLRGMPRPVRERADDPLPTREMVKALHAASRSDAVLYAALILIDELAFTVTDLTRLRWADVKLAEKKLIRKTESLLPPRPLQALRALSGDTLYQAQPQLPFFPHEFDLRRRIWKACGVAGLPYLPPSKLRQAGLRDHAHVNAAQVGYLDPHALTLAVDLARRLEPLQD